MDSLAKESRAEVETRQVKAPLVGVHSSIEVRTNLPQLVLKDIFNRHIVITVLFSAIVLFACAIVYITFMIREATVNLQTLEAKQHALQTEWRELRLEQSTLGEHSRIESIAREHLGMRYLNVSEERVIKP